MNNDLFFHKIDVYREVNIMYEYGNVLNERFSLIQII